MSLDILKRSCTSPQILESSSTLHWYDGSDRPKRNVADGQQIPWVPDDAIVEAFDAMTTDHVYRRLAPERRWPSCSSVPAPVRSDCAAIR